MATIFWSWQSDVAQRETRHLIREALQAAITLISADLEEADRPELDHDTRGVPGSPDIVATILQKIDDSSVFVADVTPIAISDNGKHVANPNVSIELGYAKKALGTQRIVLVWNTAITGATPEHLPFDMRHRRAPISYALAEGCSRADLQQARFRLTETFVEALRASLAVAVTSSKTLSEPPWRPSTDKAQSMWNDGPSVFIVNRGHRGPAEVAFAAGPRAFARIIPEEWKPVDGALQILDSSGLHPAVLGRAMYIDWGPSPEGFLAYRTSESIEKSGLIQTATRWFRSTGEFWGIDSGAVTEHNGKLYLSNAYLAERWVEWLSHNLRVCRAVGGRGPIHVKLGLVGLTGTTWARASSAYGPEHVALEDAVHYQGVIRSDDENAVISEAKSAFKEVLAAYGMSPMQIDEFKHFAGMT